MLLDSADHHIEREGARALFLRELVSLCPHVVDDLTQKNAQDWAATVRLEGARWVTDWVDGAQAALQKVKSRGEPLRPEHLSYYGEPYPDPLGMFPKSELTGVIEANPLEEGRDTFMKRVEEHWQARVAYLEELGYAHTNPKPKIDHLRWLIQYQVKGESFTEIARDVKGDHAKKTVTEAIKAVAALIDLPLRKPQRGGRPPKPSPFSTT